MKNINFNQLKNVKTPDAWVEKALDIPNTAPEAKGKIIPFLRKTKYIATAASVVLCCALGIFLFSSFDRNGYIIPMPSKENTEGKQSSSSTPIDESTPDCKDSINTINTQNNSFPHNYFDYENRNAFTGGNNFLNPPIIPYPTEYSTTNQNVTNPQGGGTVEIISDIQNHTTAENTQGYVDNNNSQTANTSQNISYSYETQSPTKPTEFVPPATSFHPATSSSFGSTNSHQKETSNTGVSERPNAPSASWTSPTEGVGPSESRPPMATAPDYFTWVIRFFPAKDTKFNIRGSISCHIEGVFGETYSEKYSSAEVCSHISRGVEFSPKNKIGGLECGEYKVTFYDYFGNSVTKTCLLMNGDYDFYE